MIDLDLIMKCKKLISDADAVLIGAGSGLSTAAGLEYGGKRFTDNFASYIEKYNLKDMYSAAFYPYSTLEEKWGYFSRHIKINRYDAQVGKLYLDLLKMVEDKNYFVLTTNADSQFFRANYDKNKIFATQGDYDKFQCEKACHDKLYYNEETIKQMVEQQFDCKIPSELIPICPVCGGNLVAHLRMDGYFVENEEWETASRRYSNFIKQFQNKKLVLLEFGVGFNTPSIIRWPFEQITLAYADSTLIRVNKENVESRYNISQKNIMIKGDIAEFISKLTL